MGTKKSLNKILIGVILGSAVLGVGGVLARKNKVGKFVGYIKKGNQGAIRFLKNLFRKNNKDAGK